MVRGYLYWSPPWTGTAVRAWKLSSTLKTDCCVAALEESLLQGQPVKASLVNRLP